MIEIKAYVTPEGKEPFTDWFRKVDRHAQNRVLKALDRLEESNTGSLKSVGSGVHEIRITFGPAYRIYLGWDGDEIVILLLGGTKKRQSDDIALAKKYWKDFQKEKQQ